ncbi:MAG: hypothetical protein EOO99_00880 [Pedobacter sp.]|nr:MAG: hypothetical protein EOO99_00880 [Pedobacter sp.]
MALACTSSDKKEIRNSDKTLIGKGLYSFGPELKFFFNCEDGKEYWVADSAKSLELAYHNLGFEKPYTPVYIEVEFHYVKSDTIAESANYDSTMVVTKVLKVSKEIPEGPCSE